MSAVATRARSASPRVAAAWSVIPGAGQIYNGQWSKALYFFFWSVVKIAGALTILLVSMDWGRNMLAAGAVIWAMVFAFVMVLVFIGIFISGLHSWGSAFLDAHRSAAAISRGEEPPSEPISFTL